MKGDNYTKLLVALLIICAIVYCVTHARIAMALERALSLAESEAQRRAEAERGIAGADFEIRTRKKGTFSLYAAGIRAYGGSVDGSASG